MSDRKLAILGIIAVVMAGLAFLQSRFSRTYTPGRITVSPLIEGLDIDQVQGIVITSGDASESVRLDRQGDGFAVRNKENYPADTKKVNSLISNCLDIRISSDRQITSNPDNQTELGVTSETARYGIDFLGGDDNVIVGLLISKAQAEGDQSFSNVRLSGQNDVYRLTDVPYFSTRPMDYIDTQVLQVDRENIVRVTVTDPNQTSYTLTSPAGSSEILLEDMPTGKQFKGSLAKTLFGSLTYFRIEDVLPAAQAPSLEFNDTYVCELSNHIIYTIRLAKTGEKIYCRVSARYTGPEPEVQNQVESAEQLKEREALFLAKDSVEKFTRKNSGWIYVIPSYKADEMTRSKNELLENIPQPQPENVISESPSGLPSADESGNGQNPTETQ